MNKMEHKPYKGYIVIPRGMVLPFLKNLLRPHEFGVFIIIAIECDWDRHHSTYGCLTKSDGELASRWGCDISTVWRYKKKLLKMGFLVHQDNLVRVKYFEWFEAPFVRQLAKIPIATMQELIAKTQELIADMQGNIAYTQHSQGQNRSQSFNVSSKGNLRVSNDEEDESFSDEELDRIVREIDKEAEK